MFSKIASIALGVAILPSLLVSAAPTQLHKQQVTVVSNCINSGQVALTFDDGLYQYELDIIKHLGESKATFFLNGNSESDGDGRMSYNDLLLSALSTRGYKKMFLWSDDTQDGNSAPVDQSKGVFDLVAAAYPEPRMILGHSVYNSTANDVVPYGVDKLTTKGYKLVAVDTCMGNEGEWPYEWVGQPQTGKWQC
ncbi:hypothetical protein QFC22_006116 [Naganishia vaughanmartiniae]|uniref:Uncharacterized protein n=1 Tax=Naganishia vaughanmartiniae TaxID=1424756 RepID=A0ACC2WMM3_9TREE|nr:hypothetical protein QFC22_006116 [Naganishia vaughanmartiniae]